MRPLLIVLAILILVGGVVYYFSSSPTTLSVATINKSKESKKKEKVKSDLFAARLKEHASVGKTFAKANKLSTTYAFLLDMGQPSGQYRFYVYDFKKDSIVLKGLVAHGSCNTRFLETAQFSNTPDCGCSSLGKYKIGNPYKGQFGKAYKLHGLEKTNSNAFQRFVVLHAYDCVPDIETDPQPICNSLGCPMVSYDFLKQLSTFIDQSDKPILLWIYQ